MPSESLPCLSDKSKSVLESLDVPEVPSTVKARRRSRRPFTAQEDEALLKGHANHGFQWTLIQQDKQLNLGHRRATDLRDRFRTKFPDAYREGGSANGIIPQTQTKPAKSTESTATAQEANGKPRALAPKPQTAVPSVGVSNPMSVSAPTSPQALLPDPTTSAQLPAEDHAGASGADAQWEDNTLRPLVWDELS